MGYRPNGSAYVDLKWIATIGGMVGSGARVRATCRKCSVCLDVDLAPLLVRLGPNGTLMNRHPKCRVFNCDGRVIFFASPGDSTPFMPCIKRATPNP